MKVSIIPAMMAVLISAALTYAVYSMGSEDESIVLLTIGTALTFLISIGTTMAVNMTDGRDSVNLKVFGGLMFIVSAISAFCFAGFGINIPTYVVITTIILMIQLSVLWKCS